MVFGPIRLDRVPHLKGKNLGLIRDTARPLNKDSEFIDPRFFPRRGPNARQLAERLAGLGGPGGGLNLTGFTGTLNPGGRGSRGGGIFQTALARVGFRNRLIAGSRAGGDPSSTRFLGL